MCAKFVSLKSSPPVIRCTHVPNLGRWIIYPESTKNSYRILKIANTKEEQNSVYPWQGSQTKSSPIPTQSVCAHLKYFAHCIHSSILWSSEKWPVQNTPSVSCSHFLSNHQWKEQLGQCLHLKECQTELDPCKWLSSVFLKDQEEHSMQADWFWI
jgi:hypothetical protein